MQIRIAVPDRTMRQEAGILVGPQRGVERVHALGARGLHDGPPSAIAGLLEQRRQGPLQGPSVEMIEPYVDQGPPQLS